VQLSAGTIGGDQAAIPGDGAINNSKNTTIVLTIQVFNTVNISNIVNAGALPTPTIVV
jgi:hypothetical protein